MLLIFLNAPLLNKIISDVLVYKDDLHSISFFNLIKMTLVCATLEKINNIFEAKPDVSDLSNHKEAQCNFQRLFLTLLVCMKDFIQ